MRIHQGEVVLAVSIYQENHPSRKLQEFNVLGSQTLASLRDAITCGSDIWMESENQKRTQKDRKVTATQVSNLKFRKKRYPSYFFINGCFYSDTRSNELKDRADDPCE